VSTTVLFQSADAAFSAFLLATIHKAGNVEGLAREAAKRQMEVASVKGPLDSVPHFVNAALCHLAVGEKSVALAALQRAAIVAPPHVAAHLKAAMNAIAPPPPKSEPAPAPAKAAPIPAKPAEARVEAPKSAEAPKPAAETVAKPAEVKPAEAQKVEPPKL
jgi:outer membrane biosynthesis protein TonB